MSWTYTGFNPGGLVNWITSDVPNALKSVSTIIPGVSVGNGLSKALTGSDTWDNASKTLEGGSNDILDKANQTLKDLGPSATNILKKYWYVPVVIGGAYIGIKAIGNKSSASAIAKALSKN